MKTHVSIILGFGAGALIGFLYGQNVRSQMGDAITTDFSGAKLTVTVDTAKALTGGLSALIQ